MFGINFSKYGINSAIFLITILLFSLVLCSFLGGGNCSKREGMTSSTSTPEQIPTEYKGTDGSTATLNNNVITTTNGVIIDTFNATNSTSTSTTATEFTSDKTGNYARLTNKAVGEPTHIQDPDNPKNIKTTQKYEYTITVRYPTSNPEDPEDPNDNSIPSKPDDIYTATIDVTTSDPDPNASIYRIPRDGSADYSHGSGINFPTTYYANGKTLRVVYDDTNGVYYITVTDPVSGTIIYNSTAATDQASLTKYTFTGTNGGSAVVVKSDNCFLV